MSGWLKKDRRPDDGNSPCLTSLAENDRYPMSSVSRRTVWRWLRPHPDTVLLFHQYDMKCLLAWHSWEGADAIPDRERIAAMIPMEANRCSGAMLVCIAIPAVFVKQEVGIFSAINANFQWVFSICGGLHNGPHGNNAALLHQDWNLVQWGISHNRLSALIGFSGPEIYPFVAGRQDARCDSLHAAASRD